MSHFMQILLAFSFVLACIPNAASAFAPAAPSRAAAEASPVKLRILAAAHEHEDLIQTALKQVGDEDAAGQPRVARVVDKKTGRAIADWVRVDDAVKEMLANDKTVVTREASIDGDEVLEVLVIIDRWGITGADFAESSAVVDSVGQPCVQFQMTIAGEERFAELTKAFLPKQNGDGFKLGIVVDGRLISAPRIQSIIRSAAQISGNFSKREVDDLVDRLNRPKPAN